MVPHTEREQGEATRGRLRDDLFPVTASGQRISPVKYKEQARRGGAS